MDSESDTASFGAGMRRRILEEFAVSYYNGSIKPNLAERNPNTGRDAEFLMDAPQFGKVKREEVWASSSAVGTGYQFKVVYKDKRFSDLDRLLRMYSGNVSLEENDKAWVEQNLYDLILLLIKEKRLPQSFKIQPAKDPRIDTLVLEVERLTRVIGELEKRVTKVEESGRVPMDIPPPAVPQTSS
jgi:hypothetical protein